MNLRKNLTVALLPFLLIACDSHVDDQTIITAEQDKVVNPKVSERDFLKINSQHKVLLAVMDSGVDYNHPLLEKNIHFKLNEEGLPSGQGWDYTGNDSWPSPFVARTNFFNPKLTADEQQRSLAMLNASLQLNAQYPELARFFPSERNIEEEETEGFDHGTHVAGLASYDSPEIGILSYRVFPLNTPAMDVELDETDVSANFGNVLIKGLRQAVKDGATVVNMSLGITLEASESEKKKDFFDNFRKELTQVVVENPEVIFVVAAGNDGRWIDGTKVDVLPCFIPKKNVICVSALTEEMEPASFSNIIKSDEITTIFAWGEEILSTVPGNSCTAVADEYSSIAKGPQALAKFAEMAKAKCTGDKRLSKMSGTSMASPVIARKVAKLRAEFPSLSATEIKHKLFASTVEAKLQDISISKLPVEKPSWYANANGQKNKRLSRPLWNFILFQK